MLGSYTQDVAHHRIHGHGDINKPASKKIDQAGTVNTSMIFEEHVKFPRK